MANFSNTQSVAKLEAQGIFYGIAHNPNTGKYFLVETDADGNQISSGSQGSISSTVMEELLAIPANQRNGIPTHYVISDIEVEDDETGEINTFKMLHKQGSMQPLLFGARKQTPVATKVTPKVTPKVVSKSPLKKVDEIF
jgi:hypothetical protein